jgi:hypothetical protein
MSFDLLKFMGQLFLKIFLSFYLVWRLFTQLHSKNIMPTLLEFVGPEILARAIFHRRSKPRNIWLVRHPLVHWILESSFFEFKLHFYLHLNTFFYIFKKKCVLQFIYAHPEIRAFNKLFWTYIVIVRFKKILQFSVLNSIFIMRGNTL